MILVLSLLLAASPTRITGSADVVQLCRHLTGLLDAAPDADPVKRAQQFAAASKAHEQAVDQEYELLLPPREFQFGNYNSEGELLAVNTRLAAGHGLLDLEPDSTSGDVALDLNAGPDEATAAYGLWAKGNGALRVTFDLDDATTCEGSPASPPWLLSVHVLTVSFIDDRGHLVLDGAGALSTNEHVVLGQTPGIAVQSVVALEGKVDPARVAVSVQGTTGLQQCYSQALGDSPQLEGTVVFRAQVDAHGHPGALQVALEDLGRPELIGCLGNSLKGVTLAGAAPGSQLLLPLELKRL